MSYLAASTWWQPGAPEEKLHGVLHDEAGRGWILTLGGSFGSFLDGGEGEEPSALLPKSFAAPTDYPILLGLTHDGKAISAFGCQVVNYASGRITVWPETLAYGVHFDGVEDFTLKSLSVRYSNLDAWASVSAFDISIGQAPFRVDVHYSKPEPLRAEIENGTELRLEYSASIPGLPAVSQVQIVQRAWLTVESHQARRYKELLDLLTRFADLIALAIGQPIRPIELKATCEAQSSATGSLARCSLILVHNREPIAPELPDVDSPNMLFTALDIRDRFGVVVNSWFRDDRNIESLYQLYFGTVRSPWMYVEHRLFNMFQALESYDRRTRVVSPEKEQERKERLDRILKGVGSRDKRWLQNKLRYSHEPNAVDRIRDLVKGADADWLLTEGDIALAADLRNYYTHYSADVEARLPATKDRPRLMFNVAVRLQVLCEVVLMRHLGQSTDWIRARFEKVRRLERRLAA